MKQKDEHKASMIFTIELIPQIFTQTVQLDYGKYDLQQADVCHLERSNKTSYAIPCHKSCIRECGATQLIFHVQCLYMYNSSISLFINNQALEVFL